MARKKKNVNSPSKGHPEAGYVELSVEHLRELLGLLKGVIYRRATRKDYQSVILRVTPTGEATLAGGEPDTRLVLRLETIATTGFGTLLIPMDPLSMLMDTFSEPRVKVYLDNLTEVRLAGLQTTLTLPGYDPEKELRFEVENCIVADGWMFGPESLSGAIARTRPFIDPASTRYALGYVCVTMPEDGDDRAEFASTDGRRMSIVRVPVDRLGEPEARWRPVKDDRSFWGVPMLNGKALPLIQKLCKRAGQTDVGIAVIPGQPIDLEKGVWTAGRVQVVTSDAVLTMTMPVEGRFPRYRDAFPTSAAKAWVLLPEPGRFADLLTTTAAASDSESKSLEVTMAGGCIMAWAESARKGKAQVAITELEMEGKATFTMDALMFRQFFDAIGDRPIRIEFHGTKEALVIQVGNDQEYIQMPMSKEPDSPKPKAAPEPVAEAKPEAEPEPAIDEFEGDEPEDDGDIKVPPPPEPEPVGPVAAVPETVGTNGYGHHEPGTNGKPKGRRKK